MRNTFRLVVIATALLTLSSGRMTAQQSIPNPEQYFGFKIGSDGELARYPKILDYFQLLAKQTDRVKYEELGKNPLEGFSSSAFVHENQMCIRTPDAMYCIGK